MIDKFFKDKDTYKIKNRFGEFLYDIDVDRKIIHTKTIDKEKAKKALLIIRDIFEKNGLRFFLIFGTALGAVREKGFIEHDDDIDLGIYKKDIELLKTSISELINDYSFKIVKISTLNESVTLVYKNVIIDIGLFKKIKNIYIYNDFYENKMPLKFLDTLESVVLFEKKFFVPYDVCRYLSYQYGKDWMIPKQNWNYFDKYFGHMGVEFLRFLKNRLKTTIKDIKNIFYLIGFKIGFLYAEVLKRLNIKGIKSITKSGQGFCNTFIIDADKSYVLKQHNPKKFEYFKEDYKKVEPIYNFKDYKERFLYEKEMFEKLNGFGASIFGDIIVFDYIDAKPLSSFLGNETFFIYLKSAIEMLKIKKISHGDFHIDNILISSTKNIYIIDFEMLFSNYLTKKEKFYYDVYYLFAKLQAHYPDYFKDNFDKLKLFMDENFTSDEIKEIILVANKTKKYFFSVNGASIELFR